MVRRITEAQLEKQIALLNKTLGRPQEPYSGGGHANVGCLHTSYAYGGVRLEEITSIGGSCRDILGHDRLTKIALYDIVTAMLWTAQQGQKE